jgi:hypothetical protein
MKAAKRKAKVTPRAKATIPTNAAQKIQIQRMRLASFNDFDGDMVADSLIENRELWDAFLWGRFGYGNLIELRDLDQGYVNTDTLMLMTTKARLPTLLKVIKTWRADEVGYNVYRGRMFRAVDTAPFHNESDLFMALGSRLMPDQVILRIWWD